MRTSAVACWLAVVLAVSGCGGGSGQAGGSSRSGPATGPSTSSGTAPGGTTSSSTTDPVATPGLDSMVVLGHSGTTGYNSDPDRPDQDARENSWATGTNPAVDSIYQRLVASHPALEGHATSLGVDGSTVDDLADQVESMMRLDPLPDLVVIQTIDNDMQCDGSDVANEKAFGRTLGAVLDDIDQRDPGAQVFFVDQWASVATYTRATQDQAAAVAGASGDGPCDTFTPGGKVRPAGIASEQEIVDGYYAQITRVCAAHASCWTDDAALQDLPLTMDDLTPDLNHLSVAGQRKMARAAWAALPAAIKNRT